MTLEQIKEIADPIRWWHTIDLGQGYVTKGRVGIDHCSPKVLTKRFGIPEDMTGKSVLDIGAWDGLMSFEAEKRGASKVVAIDIYQAPGETPDGFLAASRILGSNVELKLQSLTEHAEQQKGCALYDVVFYFGVLYHVENPIDELKKLYNLTGEYCLIETAVSTTPELRGATAWEFLHGKENDPTNVWYPTKEGLIAALRYAGFSSVEIIYNLADIRMTFKACR
jgi:tRNA (mo5U34)-methyltransferase